MKGVYVRSDNIKKLARDEALRDYYFEHPQLSYRELGAIFNITRQRAWLILHPKETVTNNGKN